MDIYLAPLEGVTGHVFREAYDRVFGDIDKYFTPFISANDHLNDKTIRELGIGCSRSLTAPLIPQILGNDAIRIRNLIEEIRNICGADEFNLNFGCPSGTVSAKGRGSGIFKDLSLMDELLDNVCDFCERINVRLSIKTRIGYNDCSEWPKIVEIYNKYPFEEIIIHPRVRADQYNGSVNKEAFEYAQKNMNVPLCFNGDIRDTNDYSTLCKQFPMLGKIMIGRGIVRNPGLVGEIVGLHKNGTRDFIEEIENKYLEEMKREEYAVMRMKEFWYYYSDYIDGFEEEKKELKKAKSFREYKTASRAILNHI